MRMEMLTFNNKLCFEISELLIPVIKNNNLHGFIRKIKSRDRSLEESPARDPPRRTGKQKIAPQFIVG